MKQAIRKIIIGALLIFILEISITCVAVAETTVNYTVDPDEPTPLSDVTITAEIDGEDTTSVYLEMQECTSGGVCFGWNTNVSMDSLGSNEYQAQFVLEYEDATYFSIRLAIERDGVWETTSEHKVYLDISDPGNGNNDTGNSTPGFETVLFLISLIAGTIMLRRKRL